ncbi:MAG: aspartate-semialdehyde dehydrogenase, partial [Halobacteriovoraceae bacterium]|nr:aspartate-semialdehyde dehydrogenase [Halobacteriovoraceae bacterium]
DAASTLRMAESSTLILDPVNREVIDQALNSGCRDFIGANCTVSLMLMAIGGLYRQGLVEWVSSMTYQAASGGGANNMRELLTQMGDLANAAKVCSEDPANSILEIDRAVGERLVAQDFPHQYFGVSLAGSLIPWIDCAMENGQTKEEWKAMAESNKILKNSKAIPVDGTCVRIGAMRSHSQGLTVKLTPVGAALSVVQLEEIIHHGNDWVEIVPNTKVDSINHLTPAYTSGSLKIPVGRIRKMNLGDDYLNCFTVGDQLLWGAAEPLRRFLELL